MASARVRRLASLAPACLLLLGAATAHGEASASDKAAAEALFDQGLRLMKQGDFSDACPKLEESERIDPAVGTLLYLGECYDRVGKTASAWATFREAASLATTSDQSERARIASNRAQELQPKLSRLSIELAPEVAQIPGVVVKRGPLRLDKSLYGTALPVDPGEYRIEVSAPGYETWSTPIKVEPGGASASVRVPALVKAPEAAPAPAPATPPPGPAHPALHPLSPPPQHSLSTQQTLGLIVGGIGVVGAGFGTYFGIRAISKNSDADSHCDSSSLCDPTGVALGEQARRSASNANIAFVAGGVLLATGAVLYVTGSPGDSDRLAISPLVGPGVAAGSLRGSF